MSLSSPRAIWQQLSTICRDMHPITVLFAGICIQTLLVSFVPRFYVLLPVASWLAYHSIFTALVTLGYVPNPYLGGTILGPSQATIPNKDGSMPENTTSPDSGSDRGVVCFIVGWSINHPAGQLAPGAKSTLDFFSNNFADMEKNREKWGFLGRTPLLTGQTESGGTHLLIVSYWKDLEHLAEFSRGSTHRAGMLFLKNTMRKLPYLGLMHETYAVPKGHWENLYSNSPPIGFGQIKYLIEASNGESGYMSSIVKAAPGGIGFKRLQSSVSAMQAFGKS